MGYNPQFIYPKNGGIECLPLALAKPIESIYTDQIVQYVDPRKKFVRLANGREERFDYLISTIPLPVLFNMLGDTPDWLKDHAKKLAAASVLNINIGIDRPGVSDQHWIYFPEDQFVFSRVGFPANFSDSVAPPDTSSMYIEITHRPDDEPDIEEQSGRALQDLVRCGLLRAEDNILTRHVLDIKYAYVVFDRHRQAHLQNLIDYLQSRGIYTCGRYGQWDYYSMEDSILSGKAAAEALEAHSTNAVTTHAL
jgi:UDP-galactopyranose mutase